MRVLMISNYFPPNYAGGAELSAFNACYGLRNRGEDCAVLSINGRLPEEVDQQRVYRGVPVQEVGYRVRRPKAGWQVFDPRVYRRVLCEIRRFRPDVVHVHNVSGTSLAPFLACRRLAVPVVLTLHDYWLLCPNNMLYRADGTLCDPGARSGSCRRCFRRYDFWGNIPGRRRVFSWAARGVSLFVSPSQALIDLHVAAGYARRRFRLLRNGILREHFQQPSTDCLREVAEDRGLSKTLLFAGAIVESKGMATLIQALPLLERYVDRLCLLVAGWGDQQFVNALQRHTPSPVRMLGKVPFYEMGTLYSAADLTLVPSVWYDNSPTVIYESLLGGTPVLGSAIGGIPELIREGETGYLVPAGDPVALTEGVVDHFARAPLERRHMRRRCTQYARQQFDIDVHLGGLLSIYREASGKQSAQEEG